MAKLYIDNTSSRNNGFKVQNVIFHRMLNCTNIKNNNNKFYEAKLEVSSSGEFRIHTHFGRVGESGDIDFRYFDTQVTQIEAEKHYNKLINSKLRGKGSSQYTEIEVDTATITETKLDINTLSPIDRLIMMLYDEAVTTVKKQIKTPLGNLSKAQIHKTKQILDDLYNAIENKLGRLTLEDLSSKLYTNLPQISSSRLVALPIIDNFKKLNEQIELLDIIGSLVHVQSALDGDAKAKYEATGANITLLPESNKEWKRIEEYIKVSQSKNHNANLHVKNIYKVSIKGEEQRFNPNKLKVMELFHGTRSANILNILSQGLLIKPKTAIHTGSMFGNGIYFADQSTKSSQYAHQWANNKYDSAFLFLCDVGTGKMKEYANAQSHLHSAPAGYDSVKGVEGSSLLHNEYIVYNTNQSKIKYLIEFSTSRRYK